MPISARLKREKVAFRAVRAGTFERAAVLVVVDALGVKPVVIFDVVPPRCLVGVDRAAWLDPFAYCFGALAFMLDDEGQRPPITLSHHDHGLTLAGLVLPQAPVHPVLDKVLWLHIAAEVRAVDLGRYRLPQLVEHHEAGLMLSVEHSFQVQGRLALGAIDENHDIEKDLLDRHLAPMEDRAGSRRELLVARLAVNRPAKLTPDRRPMLTPFS